MRRLAALTLLLITLLALAVPACAQDSLDRLEDLSALCSGIKIGHKNPFSVISEEEFDAQTQSIAARLDTMTDAQFYYELRALVASIGDAHTTIDYNDSWYAHLKALPFAVLPAQGRWYAAILPAQNADMLGWEVLAIDGMPTAEVFERAKSIISHENDVWAAQQFSNTVNFLEALQFLGVASADDTGVTLTLREDDAAEPVELFLPALSEEEIMTADLARLTPQSAPVTAASGYYRALELGGGAFFIQYNACREAPDLPMADFTSAVGELLRAGDYGKLILDLRYNTGGNSAVIEPLIAELHAFLQEHDLPVYALIGEDTFSSGIIGALDVRKHLGATLVGSPTGGSVNGYGELKSFTLPNSPMTVFYSTKYFDLVPGYEGSSLIPDIAVEATIDDLIAGRDAVVDYVLGL